MNIFRISLLMLPLLAALPAQAGQDDYYARDIFQAIKEAGKNTHHYDYSSALRYNRSTSLSIQLPRLLNQEMAQTIIETPDAIADTMAKPANPSLSISDSLTGQKDSVRMDSSPTSVTQSSPISITVR